MRLARSTPAFFAVASALVLLSGACGGSKSEFHPPVSPETTRADAPTNASPNGVPSATPPDAHVDQSGLATWYGGAFAGRKTASGERFDPTKMTAAHRKLPLGTWVEVRRVDTGATVRVKINDRGPFGDDKRVIDLSRAAGEALDMIKDGVVKVEIRIVDGP